MNLEDLKKSMSTLDEVLAEKSGEEISFNIRTCIWAQSRIARQYRNYILNCSILAVLFISLWISGNDQAAFPPAMKGMLGILMGIGAIVYALLYRLLRKIQVTSAPPMTVMKQVASLRLYNLIAEIGLAIGLTVFFTIFLSNLWAAGIRSFWLVAGGVFTGVIVGAIMLPKKIRDFNYLTAMD